MAVLQQERHTEFVSGTQELFVITNLMVSATIPAQLPHLFVFVQKIVTRDDPKDDVLTRVARISDLSTLPLGRDAGLASGAGTGLEYLTMSTRVAYTTLTEALTAMQAFQDRVNQLIEDWINFQAQFNAPTPAPALITLPRTDPTQVAALIAAYKAAKEDRYNKQLAKATADATLATANGTYTSASTAVATVQAFAASANSVNTEMSTLAGAYTNLKVSGVTFLGVAGCAAAPDQSVFQTALNSAAAQQVLNTQYTSDASALYGALSTYVSGTLAPAVTTAHTALTAAQADQITKAQQLTSALALETSTLAAVIAVCPDFASTSICTVPG